ncbi:unnamed protein product [Brassica rapa subsp. trilocularis]
MFFWFWRHLIYGGDRPTCLWEGRLSASASPAYASERWWLLQHLPPALSLGFILILSIYEYVLHPLLCLSS